MADFPGFNIDLHAGFILIYSNINYNYIGLGGLMYAIGTYLFTKVTTNEELTVATHWFVAGGTLFTLSGLFMQYRYYFVKSNSQI